MTDALMVIDMQQGSFGPATPRSGGAGVVGRLNLLADEIRAANGSVVFIQHDGPRGRLSGAARTRARASLRGIAVIHLGAALRLCRVRA